MSGGIFISNGDQGLQLYNRSFLGRTHIGGDLFTKVLVLKQPILVLWCFEILNLILLQFVTWSGCKQKAAPRIRKDWSDLWKEVKTLSTWLARQVVSGASADIPSIQFLGQCQPTVQRNTSVYTEKYTGVLEEIRCCRAVEKCGFLSSVWRPWREATFPTRRLTNAHNTILE